MTNFWKNLPEPFLVLAPMDDVTDVVFREIIAGTAKPDVFFTEFTSSDGLNSPGRDETLKKLKYTENQRPIVAQIWGTVPGNMQKAAEIIGELGFDGVDINMGCPDKAVLKKGSGAAHSSNFTLAKEIIKAVRNGSGNIAVSVKTRLGIDRSIADEWLPFLLEQKIDALTVHGRTAFQLSTGEADWDVVGKAVEFRNKIAPGTIIVGNGDIKSYREAIDKYEKYKVDGVMLGRGIFTNPWLFEKTIDPKVHSEKEYLDLLVKHVRLFNKIWGNTKNFEILKKFFKMYVREFDGANELRQKLMECKSVAEIETNL